MHIAILAPSDKSFISGFLPNHEVDSLPVGYTGAPFIATIIAELLKRNHQVTAITTTVAINNDYQVKEFGNGNFKWIVIPGRPRSFRMNGQKIGYMLDFFAHEQAQMTKSIREVAPDFVHAHWSYEFAGAALASGYPCLVTIHDNAIQILRFFKNTYRFGRLLMSEYILDKVRFASTVSPYMLPYVKKRCNSVKVIPNPVLIGVSATEIASVVHIKSQTLNEPRLMMVSNGWDARKNGISGLLAFKQLQQQYPDATLHLFGNGSEVNGVANQDAKKLALKNAFFYGAVAHERLLKELQQAHLLIHPALEESFGVVLIEAMSCGVPVVGGINSGAVPWVIKNEKLLADVTKPDEITNKLLVLLTDVAIYRQVSIEGYHNVLTRFSADSVVDNYVTYYDEILNAW